MIQQCVDLLVGRAFVPDPLDSTVSLARRFAKRPLVAVRMFKEGFEVATLAFPGGVPTFGPVETFTNGAEDADAAFLRTFAERHKAKDCLIILTTGYTAVLSGRTRRPENEIEAIQLMRDNPERLLGEPAPQGCKSSIAYHPTHNFAVVFNHKEQEINAAVGLATRAELNLVRLQCGMTSLLIHVLGNCWDQVGKDAELLFVDRASLFYLPISDGAFGRPLFDIGLKEAALRQAIDERVGKLKAGGKVLLVDLSGLGVEAMIAERQAGIAALNPLGDRPQPALWVCATDLPLLGYDLFPNERTVRPFAPARLRPVPLVFWGTLAASVFVIGFNTIRSTQTDTLAVGVKTQLQMLTEAKKHAEAVAHDVQARAKTASAISHWLQISPPTQALLIEISDEIEAATQQGIKSNRPVAQVDSISIARQEGQPQMRIAVVAFGDAAAANRVFQRISALFGRKGYSTVDLKESLVPQGFRYEHLVNMPDSLPR